MVKLFKIAWAVSLFAFLGALLYVYAGLQENFFLPGYEETALNKEYFFYFFLVLGIFINVLVFSTKALMPKSNHEHFRSWFYGVVIALNIFFIVSMGFIQVFNSGERFQYGHIGYVIYSSLALIMVLAFSWPVYLLISRSAK